MTRRDPKVPFRFTGKLNKLTVKVGPVQLADADKKRMEAMLAERD